MDKELHGFFSDGGTPLNPDLAPKPSLCVTCKHDGKAAQEIPCALNRMDQQGRGDFKCEAYELISKDKNAG